MDVTYILIGLVGCGLGAFFANIGRRRSEREWRNRVMTERAAARELLEMERRISLQAHAEQRALFESMGEGVLLLDQSQRITIANRSVRQLLHLNGELRGKTILEAVRLPFLANMAAGLPVRGVVRHAELELPGSPARLLEINASVVTDESGQQHGSIYVFHDLTRIKQLENTRREFVANVSHELRTPLSLIKGFVETLLDCAEDDPGQVQKFLLTIQKHANRLSFLIEDLLTISQLESGPATLALTPVRLHDLTERVIDDLSSKANERKARIENHLAKELLVAGDAERLQQVLFNLLENAIKYGRDGGSIHIQSESTGRAEMRIAVIDDGPGIPPEAQARVFERFFRVDRARSREAGGTGLGLSIVKHIIQAHGGKVWLESELGKGSTFFFTLRPTTRQEIDLANLEFDESSHSELVAE